MLIEVSEASNLFIYEILYQIDNTEYLNFADDNTLCTCLSCM